jgi:hypothetical protein
MEIQKVHLLVIILLIESKCTMQITWKYGGELMMTEDVVIRVLCHGTCLRAREQWGRCNSCLVSRYVSASKGIMRTLYFVSCVKVRVCEQGNNEGVVLRALCHGTYLRAREKWGCCTSCLVSRYVSASKRTMRALYFVPCVTVRVCEQGNNEGTSSSVFAVSSACRQ